MGAAGGTFYQTESILKSPPAKSKTIKGNLWAGGELLIWQPKNGEVLELLLDVPETRNYTIHIVAALTPKSGRFYATLGGKSIGLGDERSPINLNVPYRTLLRNFSSGRIELEKGGHTLTIHNASPAPGAELGLDFIWVQKK
jgi:hypothetical protein